MGVDLLGSWLRRESESHCSCILTGTVQQRGLVGSHLLRNLQHQALHTASPSRKAGFLNAQGQGCSFLSIKDPGECATNGSRLFDYVTLFGTSQGLLWPLLPWGTEALSCTLYGPLDLSPTTFPRKCFLNELWAVYVFPKKKCGWPWLGLLRSLQAACHSDDCDTHEMTEQTSTVLLHV